MTFVSSDPVVRIYTGEGLHMGGEEGYPSYVQFPLADFVATMRHEPNVWKQIQGAVGDAQSSAYRVIRAAFENGFRPQLTDQEVDTIARALEQNGWRYGVAQGSSAP